MFGTRVISSLDWSALLGVAGVAIYAGYYLKHVVQETRLTFNDNSELQRSLLKLCPTLSFSKFYPSFLLVHRNMQTIGTKFCRSEFRLRYDREVIEVADGLVALDWPVNQPKINSESNGPLVIILHGLAGSSHSRYIKHFAFQVAKAGWNVLVFNARGMGTSVLSSHRCYNASNTEDLRMVCAHLHERYPQMDLYAVGFSMGANVLTKYVAEEGTSCILQGAVGVSNPFDLVKASAKVALDWSMQFYGWFLTRDLVNYIRRHEHHFGDVVNLQAVYKCQCLHDFDEEVILKVFADQFESREDYYQQASCARMLHNIKIPMMFLHSMDDPVSPSEFIPVDSIRDNPNLVLAATERGGHLGWLKVKFWDRSWCDQVSIEYLAAIHTLLSQKNKKE